MKKLYWLFLISALALSQVSTSVNSVSVGSTSTTLTTVYGATVLIPNAVSAGTLAGTGAATFAPQTGAGTGATAVCAASHICDSISGEVTLTSGTIGTPATGSQLIITLPITRTTQPNCSVDVFGGTTFLGITKALSTNAITVSAGVALVFGTVYTVDYVCGGN